MQNGIWADKQPVMGLFLQQIHTKDRVRKYDCFNNTLPFITENIAIKPSSWDALSEHEKEEFSMIFYGLPELMEIEGEKFDRFQRTSFDLFAL